MKWLSVASIRAVVILGSCIIVGHAAGISDTAGRSLANVRSYLQAVYTTFDEERRTITPVRPTPTPGVPMAVVAREGWRLELSSVQTSQQAAPGIAWLPANEKRVIANIRLTDTGSEQVQFIPAAFRLTDERGRVARYTYSGLVGDRWLSEGERVYGEIGFIVDRRAVQIILGYDSSRSGLIELPIDFSAAAEQ